MTPLDSHSKRSVTRILFIGLVSITFVTWMFLINSYFQKEAELIVKHGIDPAVINYYTSEIKDSITLFSIVLGITLLYLIVKKNWLRVVLIALHAGALVYYYFIK